jgi:hypothetical protein
MVPVFVSQLRLIGMQVKRQISLPGSMYVCTNVLLHPTTSSSRNQCTSTKLRVDGLDFSSDMNALIIIGDMVVISYECI